MAPRQSVLIFLLAHLLPTNHHVVVLALRSGSVTPSSSSSAAIAVAVTAVVKQERAPLVSELQRCLTPFDVLDRIGRHVTPQIDPDGSLSSLILVRLSKQLISLENNNSFDETAKNDTEHLLGRKGADTLLASVTQCLASADLSNLDALVEGTKACSILSRLLPRSAAGVLCWEPLGQFWEEHAPKLVHTMQDHHLSSVSWAFDGFRLVSHSGGGRDVDDSSLKLPKILQDAYDALDLPFCILPGCLLQEGIPDFSVATLTQEVNFSVDEIRTTASEQVVPERRQTAWQGDESVGPFCYSGKRMPRSDWSVTVQRIRDRLQQATGQYYNGCLLNLYPDGRSGMRYHIDPDQGMLWDYNTAVVSVGATRRFAFRPIAAAAAASGSGSSRLKGGQQPPPPPPHNFVVMHGDVAYMFGDCQERFQHTIKNADNKNETAPRVSLVFKRTWNYQKK